MKIYKLAHNTIENKDYEVLIDFLKRRRYLNQAKVTRKFEKKFSYFLGSKESVFVNSGSSANLLALASLKLKKGSEVIIPAFSIISTALCVIKLGLKPILIDSDLKTWNMNPYQVVKKISKD